MSGTTSISLSPGAMSDLAGNALAATSSLEFYFSIDPVATLSILNDASSSVSSLQTGSRAAVLATFSEPVADTPSTTIAIDGPDALATTSMSKLDDSHYLFVFTVGDTPGDDTITVDGAQDLAGNPQVTATTTLTVATPPAPAPSGGGGGGGGGGGLFASVSAAPVPSLISAPPAPAPASAGTSISTTSGAVLAAQTYHFTAYLVRGASGTAVLNLQKLLIALDFLSDGNAMGHFGPLTQEAVKLYQKKHDITQTGTVGPLTRANLNKEIVFY
jgi:hypothetical protein